MTTCYVQQDSVVYEGAFAAKQSEASLHQRVSSWGWTQVASNQLQLYTLVDNHPGLVLGEGGRWNVYTQQTDQEILSSFHFLHYTSAEVVVKSTCCSRLSQTRLPCTVARPTTGCSSLAYLIHLLRIIKLDLLLLTGDYGQHLHTPT